MVDLETLREAYRASSSEVDDGHPSGADWEQLALGEMNEAQERRALDHVLGCAHCAEIHRAIALVAAEAPIFDEGAPARVVSAPSEIAERRVPWRVVGLLALAAAIIVGVVVPLAVTRGPTAGDGAVVVRSADETPRVVPVAPVAEVSWRPDADVVFSWTTVGAETAVVVEVLDAEGEMVWTGPETTESETTWPAERVPGPGRYYWRLLPSESSHPAAGSELVAFDLISASPP